MTTDLTERTGELHRMDLPSLRRRTGELLASHVPLTLLLDLADPAGPDSAARYGVEQADLDWLRAG